MNRDKLMKTLWYRVRLRPLPRRLRILDGAVHLSETSGLNEPDTRLSDLEYESKDDIWIVESVSPTGSVELSNTRTMHKVLLATDQIHCFDTDPHAPKDGFKHALLYLNVRLFLLDNWKFRTEPIPPEHRRTCSLDY